MTRKLAAVLTALTVLAAVGVLTGPAPVSIVAGLLLAFGLPGAGLTAVLFRTRGQLSGAEWFMLVPALSLATLVLGGLVAWGFGVPLDQRTWLAISGSVTLATLISTMVQPALPAPPSALIGGDPRSQLPTEQDNTLVLPFFLDRAGRPAEEPKPAGSLLTRVVMPLVLVLVMIGGASWLSLNSSRSTHDDRVTALSAAPPGAVTAAGSRVVRVSASGLPLDSTYEVIVTEASGLKGVPRTVTPDDQGSWTGDVTVPGAQRSTIGLYRKGETTSFRELIIAAS